MWVSESEPEKERLKISRIGRRMPWIVDCKCTVCVLLLNFIKVLF